MNMAQPMFYKNPTPLLADKHADSGLDTKTDFSYARESNCVLIALPEFSEVSKNYPIVFTSGNVVEPVAVLGVENNKNLFINSDGLWAKDKYIPAYVRRYPFAFMQGQDEKLILCVDDQAACFHEKARKTDQRFFENGQQSALTNKMLKFCASFQNDINITYKFTETIKKEGLLVEKKLSGTTKIKGVDKQVNISGFMVIDEQKFMALSGDKLVEWNKNGYLGLIYLHFLSLSNFSRVLRMMK